MERRKRIFSEEFRREAVLRVVQGGETRTKVAADLGLQPNLLGTWVKQYRSAA